MGIDATKVYIGLADQSATSGALARGSVIAAANIPATFAAAVTATSSFTSSGYFSEDGVNLSTSISTTNIREWNRANVRRLLEEFDGTLSGTLIQLDEEAAKQCFGSGNVTKTAATVSTGTQLKIALGAHLPEAQAWALRMKDGNAKFLILIPNGQVTSGVDITFTANDPISLPIEISANDDGTGNSIYIFTDDGVFSA